MTAEALYGSGVAWRDSGAAAGAVRDHRCGAAGAQAGHAELSDHDGAIAMLAIPFPIFALSGPLFEYML